MGNYQTEKGNTMKGLFISLILFFAASVSFAQDKQYNVPVGDSPVLGPAEAPVTIIEFLDFQ
jgi:hypothetical protein